MITDLAEQETLARMLELRAQDVGSTQIARRLNEEKRYRRSGRPWTQATVWRTLDNYDAREEARRG